MTLSNRRSTNTASDDRTPDNRAQTRAAVFISLTLVHDDIELTDCHARNISNKGIYIALPRALELSMGASISLRFHIWTGHDHMTRFLRAEVARSEQRGLAANIIDHDRIANAVVQDILYYQQHERRNAARAMNKRLPLRTHLNAWIARLIS